MTQPRFAATERVRLTAESRGAIGRRWLSGLDAQVLEIADRWALTVGESPPNGTEAFVAHVVRADGAPAVLKVKIAGDDPQRQELRMLRLADGRGYARLLLADEAQNALLLEPLGPQLHRLGLPEADVLAAICATLRQAWRPAPPGEVFPTAAQKANELAQLIRRLWVTQEGVCHSATIEAALACCARRAAAFDPGAAVLSHGDAHEWNTLQAPGSASGFKFVDPDGAVAEPAYDLAIPMREWSAPLPPGDRVAMGRRRMAVLTHLTGVAEAPIWEWSVIQCVSNGLLLASEGLATGAAAQLGMAEAWVLGGVISGL